MENVRYFRGGAFLLSPEAKVHKFARPAHTIWSRHYSNLLITELVIRENGVGGGSHLFLFYAARSLWGEIDALFCLATCITSAPLPSAGCRCIKMTNVRYFVKTPPLHLIAFKIIEFSVASSLPPFCSVQDAPRLCFWTFIAAIYKQSILCASYI